MRGDWLVVIDFPDERFHRYPMCQHMHAWVTDETEARQMAVILTDRIGGDHEVVRPPGICPRCGTWPRT